MRPLTAISARGAGTSVVLISLVRSFSGHFGTGFRVSHVPSWMCAGCFPSVPFTLMSTRVRSGPSWLSVAVPEIPELFCDARFTRTVLAPATSVRPADRVASGVEVRSESRVAVAGVDRSAPSPSSVGLVATVPAGWHVVVSSAKNMTVEAIRGISFIVLFRSKIGLFTVGRRERAPAGSVTNALTLVSI